MSPDGTYEAWRVVANTPSNSALQPTSGAPPVGLVRTARAPADSRRRARKREWSCFIVCSAAPLAAERVYARTQSSAEVSDETPHDALPIRRSTWRMCRIRYPGGDRLGTADSGGERRSVEPRRPRHDPQFFAESYVAHVLEGDVQGREGIARFIAALRDAFPDLSGTDRGVGDRR